MKSVLWASRGARRAAAYAVTGAFLFVAARAMAEPNRFELLGPEVVDLQTGLVWQRCSVGMNWDGQRCTGQAGRFTWDEARGLGRDGWRPPELDELASLVVLARKQRRELPRSDPDAFPDADTGDPLLYWSINYHACASDTRQGCGLSVAFNINVNGESGPTPREQRLRVRLVRAATTTAASAATPPRGVSADGRFELNGGAARDRKTGLIWRRCMAGQELRPDLGCTGRMEEATYNETLNLLRDGWRLPTVKELSTLLDDGRKKVGQAPYINAEVFPVTLPGYDAVRTRDPYGSDRTWCVHFNLGVSLDCGKDLRIPVRLVRDAPP